MTDARSSADVFDLIGQESRLSILRALLDARRGSDDPHLRFSDLQDAAGIDDTGRFNYHLGKLAGTLVVKTPDGYRLSGFGFRILAPLTAGLYDPDRSVTGIEVPGACYECGDTLRIRAEENVLRVVCEAGHVINHGIVGYPGILADRPPEEAAETLGTLNAQANELGVSGTCPTCHGRTVGGVEWSDEYDCYSFRAPCRDCGNRFATSVGSCVATHPAVVGFLADRGVDVRRRGPWALAFQQAGAEEAVSEDPLRLRVVVGDDGGALSVTVDRDGSVVGVDRSAAE